MYIFIKKEEQNIKKFKLINWNCCFFEDCFTNKTELWGEFIGIGRLTLIFPVHTVYCCWHLCVFLSEFHNDEKWKYLGANKGKRKSVTRKCLINISDYWQCHWFWGCKKCSFSGVSKKENNHFWSYALKAQVLLEHSILTPMYIQIKMFFFRWGLRFGQSHSKWNFIRLNNFITLTFLNIELQIEKHSNPFIFLNESPVSQRNTAGADYYCYLNIHSVPFFHHTSQSKIRALN